MIRRKQLLDRFAKPPVTGMCLGSAVPVLSRFQYPRLERRIDNSEVLMCLSEINTQAAWNRGNRVG